LGIFVRQTSVGDVEFHQNRYARLLGETVRPHVRWLDVGAGHRLHSGWKHERPEDVARRADALIGCDLVTDQLRENATITAGAVADVNALPFRTGSFDLVTANMVFEHLGDPTRAFTEIARVLRPRGELVFITPNRRHPVVWGAALVLAPRWRQALARLIERRQARDIFPTYYRANTAPRISGLARRAGLEPGLIEVFPSYPFSKRPAALVALEAYCIRLFRRGPLRRFGSNIVGRLVKPALESQLGGQHAPTRDNGTQ
jgi:SAM-dependent methyltransferase